MIWAQISSNNRELHGAIFVENNWISRRFGPRLEAMMQKGKFSGDLNGMALLCFSSRIVLSQTKHLQAW